MSQPIPEAVWRQFAARHAAGQQTTGTVIQVLPFGAFVEVDGVTGLLPERQPALRTEIPVRITMIDAAKRRFTAEAV